MEASSKMYLGEGPKNFLGEALMAQMVKNLPVRQETQVRSLGWKDPLKEEMTPHCSILAWRIPWTGDGGLQSMGSQRDKTEQLTLTLSKGKRVRQTSVVQQQLLHTGMPSVLHCPTPLLVLGEEEL